MQVQQQFHKGAVAATPPAPHGPTGDQDCSAYIEEIRRLEQNNANLQNQLYSAKENSERIRIALVESDKNLDQIREESKKLEIKIVNLKNENATLIGYYLTSQKKDCCTQLVYMESVLRAGILRDSGFGPSTQPAVSSPKDSAQNTKRNDGSTVKSQIVGCYVVRRHEGKVQILVHVRAPQLNGKVSSPGGGGDNKLDSVTLNEEMQEETTNGTVCNLQWTMFYEKLINGTEGLYARCYVAVYDPSKCKILGPDSEHEWEVAEWNNFMGAEQIGNSKHAWIDLHQVSTDPLTNAVSPPFFGASKQLVKFLKNNPSYLQS